MTIDPENIIERQFVWERASTLVEPIIAKHDLDPYRTGAPFSIAKTITKVEQHIDQIIRVANWLLGEGN